MTKRMIDADALLEWLSKINIINSSLHKDKSIMLVGAIAMAQNEGFNIAIKVLNAKINELTTPKAKFMIGECVHIMCDCGKEILFNLVLIKEIFYPPHNFTGKDSIYYNVEYGNRETEHWGEESLQSLHSKPTPVRDEKTIYAILDILSKRLKDEKKDVDFLSNKVNTFINGYNRAILIAISTITDLIGKATPAPEPQESIFDADGWCWDMDKAPENTWINGSDGKDVFYGINGDFWTSNQTSRIPVTSWINEYNVDIIAWRPFPTIPKEA